MLPTQRGSNPQPPDHQSDTYPTDWLIVLGFNDMSPLWVILRCLPEKGRKEIEEIVEEMNWVSWGLMTRQPLWVILCRLPEKGRKKIEKIEEEMKERDREERGTGMKVMKQKK